MPSRWDTPDPIHQHEAKPTPMRLLDNGMLDISNMNDLVLKTATQNALTLLLRLPGEIRNTIWSLLLAGNYFHTMRLIRSVLAPKNYLALLLVCRQSYADTALLPFKLNVFRFNSNYEINWALLDLTDAQRGAMAEVHLETIDAMTMEHRYFRDARLPKAFPVTLFPGLKRVVVHVRFNDRMIAQNLEPSAEVLKAQEKLKEHITNGRDIQVGFTY